MEIAAHLPDEQDYRRSPERGAMPMEALVAPGPRVTKHSPGRPVILPSAFGHVGRARFVAAGDEFDTVAQHSQGASSTGR